MAKNPLDSIDRVVRNADARPEPHPLLAAAGGYRAAEKLASATGHQVRSANEAVAAAGAAPDGLNFERRDYRGRKTHEATDRPNLVGADRLAVLFRKGSGVNTRALGRWARENGHVVTKPVGPYVGVSLAPDPPPADPMSRAAEKLSAAAYTATAAFPEWTDFHGKGAKVDAARHAAAAKAHDDAGLAHLVAADKAAEEGRAADEKYHRKTAAGHKKASAEHARYA